MKQTRTLSNEPGAVHREDLTEREERTEQPSMWEPWIDLLDPGATSTLCFVQASPRH